MSVRVLPYGERAALLEVGSIDEVIGVLDIVQSLHLDGMEDLVPAAVTVLVSFVDVTAFQHALPILKGIQATAKQREPGPLQTVPIVYDGEDLADVAELTGLSIADVIEVHSTTEYTVAFHGFAPGFAYLVGLDPRLLVPRRTSPRTHVPAGALGMTGKFTGIYPRVSPGGWQLLGHTDVAMWDSDRAEPALLRPGMRVRFAPQ